MRRPVTDLGEAIRGVNTVSGEKVVPLIYVMNEELLATLHARRLFLIFNKLVDAEWRAVPGLKLAHMLDQSRNVTDPIESLMTSAIELTRAYAQALLVDRKALAGYQETNDALMAAQTLKRAFTTDVHPILARAGAEGSGD
jgi:L-rhamnose isomerase/sugar isomerase